MKSAKFLGKVVGSFLQICGGFHELVGNVFHQ
jgi:hypothetical protein